MARPDVRHSPSEYLAMERAAEEKHEFLDGQIYSMAGASRRHNLLVSSLVTTLNNVLGTRCEVYPSDMRVKVHTTGLYTYPDLTVVCEEPEFEDAEVDTLLNPLVVIEVLSPTTEAYDRGAKSEHYRALPSVQEILLVDQDRVYLMHSRRREDGTWTLSEIRDPDGTVHLESLGVELKIAEIYARVSVEEAAGPISVGA